MKSSQLFTKTRKQVPADEEAHNAQLLIQAGFIHKEMAGVYAFLPLGLIVLDKIKQIVREEMNAVGGQEVQMTALQPHELFEKTDRWDDTKVDNWFKTRLANGSELGLGLTHEEPIVQTLGEYVNSYKDLPLLVYQIQNKFRNELRAKSGLLRGREFVMKDMYSLARNQKEHDQIYEKVAAAYLEVFDRLGLGNDTYRTFADGGYFTQRFSDEFQTVSPVGEDTIYIDKAKRIAVNDEILNAQNLKKLGLDKAKLSQEKAVEVANIFPLETKYTDALGVYYTDEAGQQQSIIMGCYGIGISRLMGIIAEHFADDKGLVWPSAVAPAQVYLARLGDDPQVVKAADQLYQQLQEAGIETLYDDRDVRPGQKFADADLLGIPQRLVISDKTVASGKLELKARTSQEPQLLSSAEVIKKLVKKH